MGVFHIRIVRKKAMSNSFNWGIVGRRNGPRNQRIPRAEPFVSNAIGAISIIALFFFFGINHVDEFPLQ
ncbi:cell division protein [Sesbania bispinosa]|nr:cell division protein [Sesbania bispinosa]